MSVGLGTPPDSRRVTPVTGLLRRDSGKLQFGSISSGSSMSGTQASSDNQRKGVNELKPRRSFGQAFAHFFRPHSTEIIPEDHSHPPPPPHRHPGGVSSVPPSPLKPLSSATLTSSIKLSGELRTVQESASELKTPMQELAGIGHGRQGSLMSQAEEAEEAIESEEEEVGLRPSQSQAPPPLPPPAPKEDPVTLCRLENVARKLSTAAEEDDEVKGILTEPMKLQQPAFPPETHEPTESDEGGGHISFEMGGRKVALVETSTTSGEETESGEQSPLRDPDIKRPDMSTLTPLTPLSPEEGAQPRLTTSGSVADFYKRINRIRFQSECVPQNNHQSPEASPTNELVVPPTQTASAATVEDKKMAWRPVLRKRSMSCPRQRRGRSEEPQRTTADSVVEPKTSRLVTADNPEMEKLKSPPLSGGTAALRRQSVESRASRDDRTTESDWMTQINHLFPYLGLVPNGILPVSVQKDPSSGGKHVCTTYSKPVNLMCVL